MCGIFGKIYFHKKKNESDLLVDCLNSLSHRGPDDSGVYEDTDAFLGSRRLSIIDLSPNGHMPMCNKKKNLWIVFNGEIFNYLEIRKNLQEKDDFKSNTDTEVVLRLFEEKGPSCLNELRGMFAFAIWNSEKKELFLARDHLGKKPLKYYKNKDCFIFSSELKAILKDTSIPKEIDPVAIDEFLTYQYVPSPRTGFKNIFKLEPAHYLIVKKSGEIIKEKYWEPHFLPKLSMSENELIETITQSLKDSVKIRLRSDVPLGAHLSGGVDSSLIVALMSEQLNHPVKTFSIGFEQAQYNELPYAQLIAKKFKTDHHEVVIDSKSLNELPQMAYAFEEPYSDPSMIPTWFLCKETKNEVTVALNGDGGDENFAGYQRYPRYKAIQYLNSFPMKKELTKLTHMIPGEVGQKLHRFIHEASLAQQEQYPKLFGCFGEREKNNYYTQEFKRDIDGQNPYIRLEKYSAGTSLGNVDSLLYTDMLTYLPDDLLAKIDIAGMAHSLEIRSPFLDHVFVETVAKVPEYLKLNGWNRKYILKNIAASYLPVQTVKRGKQGFVVPLEYWLNSKKQLQTLFENNSLLFYFIKKDALHNLLKRIPGDGSRLHKEDMLDLWLILCLKMWLDTWFL